MPATANDLKVARSWIGNSESDATFNERYDRLGSLDAAITESLRSQLAALLESPAGLGTPDGLNVQTGENIRTLRGLLAEFLATGGTVEDETILAGGAAVTQVSRPDYR